MEAFRDGVFAVVSMLLAGFAYRVLTRALIAHRGADSALAALAVAAMWVYPDRRIERGLKQG